MTSEAALQRVGIAWTTKANEKTTMDVNLATTFADIVDEIWAEVAKPNLGCATTRELLAEITARIEIDGNLDYRTIDSD
jgi:hypothetical protein